jgi:hypothetical protein
MELDDNTVARILGEFKGLELGDARRSERILKVVAALARHPDQTLPEALGKDTPLQGAYRLLKNEAVDFDDLLEVHREQTVTRAEQAREVLVLHDTTTCRFEHADPQKIGFLATGKAGFFAHVGLVVDAGHHRRPLGALHLEPYWRTKRSGRGSRKKHLSGREVASWQDRESERWVRGVQACQEQLTECSVVHVMDREGDKYELFAHLKEHEERFVIRSKHDRRLVYEEHQGLSLREMARQQPVLLQRDVHLSRRVASRAPGAKSLSPSRPSRVATLSITATPVVLRRPYSLSADFPASISVNVVHVEELHPPVGEKPVVWTLLTSEPIGSTEQIERIIDIYRYRWLIEELFKALKTGCLFESRMFEARHPLLNLLATSLPIAVELLWMRARVTDEPDAAAEEVVTPLQIEILRTMGHRPLSAKATALQVLLAIAGLGGHLNRNGFPGWQVLGRGYQRLLDYEAGWSAARARSSKRNL